VMREVECMLGDGDQSPSWPGPLRLDESLKRIRTEPFRADPSSRFVAILLLDLRPTRP
jgi:hypothetical protein